MTEGLLENIDCLGIRHVSASLMVSDNVSSFAVLYHRVGGRVEAINTFVFLGPRTDYVLAE